MNTNIFNEHFLVLFMLMHILSYEGAINFVPEVPTYALRIFSTNQDPKELVNSPNWIHIARYTFDEETPLEYLSCLDEATGKPLLPTTLFTRETAGDIIREFIPFRNSCESLLIHCVGGHYRSKGVG